LILHAGLIALRLGGYWRGALIEGPSGAGKSDLALRALELGLRLVSDDRTRIWACQGRLFGACPAPIADLIEARGLGLLGESALALAEIRLVVVCQPPADPIERLPETERRQIDGVWLPVLRLHALQASAPAKLRRALSHLGAGP
jgi:serine kinase of HPr protein (carbohydrate metabolism regulator)